MPRTPIVWVSTMQATPVWFAIRMVTRGQPEPGPVHEALRMRRSTSALRQDCAVLAAGCADPGRDDVTMPAPGGLVLAFDAAPRLPAYHVATSTSRPRTIKAAHLRSQYVAAAEAPTGRMNPRSRVWVVSFGMLFRCLDLAIKEVLY
jgi:hypothetical protein